MHLQPHQNYVAHVPQQNATYMVPRQYMQQQPVQYVYAQSYQQPAVQYVAAPRQPVQYQVKCVRGCVRNALLCANKNVGAPFQPCAEDSVYGADAQERL